MVISLHVPGRIWLFWLLGWMSGGGSSSGGIVANIGSCCVGSSISEQAAMPDTCKRWWHHRPHFLYLSRITFLVRTENIVNNQLLKRLMSARTTKTGTKRKQIRSTNNCQTGSRRPLIWQKWKELPLGLLLYPLQSMASHYITLPVNCVWSLIYGLWHPTNSMVPQSTVRMVQGWMCQPMESGVVGFRRPTLMWGWLTPSAPLTEIRPWQQCAGSKNLKRSRLTSIGYKRWNPGEPLGGWCRTFMHSWPSKYVCQSELALSLYHCKNTWVILTTFLGCHSCISVTKEWYQIGFLNWKFIEELLL